MKRKDPAKQARRAGFTALLIIAAFSLIVVMLNTFFFLPQRFYVFVKFNFLNNLAVGSPVLLKGAIRAGMVVDIFQKEQQTYVKLSLDPKLSGKIPLADSTAFSISTRGLLGEKYINIQFQPAREGQRTLERGDTVEGLSPPSMDQMILSFSTWAGESDPADVVLGVLSDVNRLNTIIEDMIAENADDVAFLQKHGEESFGEIRGKIDTLLKGIDFLSAEYSDIMQSNKVSLDEIITHLGSITAALEQIDALVKKGSGAAHGFLTDKQIASLSREVAEETKVMKNCLLNPWILLNKDQSCPR